ncbi:DUF4395 domain-containing protein [Calidifontibacter terrae]
MALIGFPDEVNEKAARVVAGGVVVLTAATLLSGWRWLTLLLVAGFALRVMAGPRFSPLGRLAASVIAPRLGQPKIVAGAPKRFAQTVGLAFSAAAAIAWIGFGAHAVAVVLLAVLLVFAALESVVGFCAGCFVFGYLMRWGVVPEETCAACSDISLRRQTA